MILVYIVFSLFAVWYLVKLTDKYSCSRAGNVAALLVILVLVVSFTSMLNYTVSITTVQPDSYTMVKTEWLKQVRHK